jgi:ATP-dependent helicase HrpA
MISSEQFLQHYRPEYIDLGFSNIHSQDNNIEIWDEKVKKGIFDEDFLYPNQLNGQPWSEDFKKLHTNFSRNLASYKDAAAIFNIMHSNQVVLITMGTGAGKTTMLPNIMMHYYAYKKKIAVTIPRRGITESAGIFGAKLLDCELGKEVGYKHGSVKDKATENTKLLFTTDGTIKTKLTSSDPDLNEYQAVIIDEAHERNVNIDILFSLLVDVCKRRPDFKLIIMSATVDPTVFSNFFIKNDIKFKHHHVPAEPKYKIDKIFLDKDITHSDYPLYAQSYLEQILKLTDDGDIMVFFPTLTPAKKILDEITKPDKLKQFPGKPCFVAYAGSASQEEKDLIIKKDEVTKLPYYKTRGYTRCVILTTPAAESSLTTAGNVVFVIEPGFAKAVWYDPIKFANVADEVYITKASIIQRQGRTGRVCNGQAYMLYTKKFFDSLPEYNQPEILKSDLTNDVLSIMNQKIF